MSEGTGLFEDPVLLGKLVDPPVVTVVWEVSSVRTVTVEPGSLMEVTEAAGEMVA